MRSNRAVLCLIRAFAACEEHLDALHALLHDDACIVSFGVDRRGKKGSAQGATGTASEAYVACRIAS